MNTAIELHDSDLTAITYDGASTVLLFSPAYVHRSEGRPGTDAGTGWTQEATLTFSDAAFSSPAALPVTVRRGWLVVGSVIHKNLIPADGVFKARCELRLALCRSTDPRIIVIPGTSLTIALLGAPSYVEEFSPFASGDL